MKAVVEIIGEARSFLLATKETSNAASTMRRDFESLSLSASKSAEAQVKASALRISRIREEITQVGALTSAYKRGSDEQIAAMTLVARKQAELARLTGASALGASRGGSRGNLRRDEHEASGLSRGLLSGAGVGHVGLAALSGGAFFGSFVAASAGRATIDAATQAAATEKQLAAQYKASGQSLEEYRSQIDKTLGRVSALSGFNQDDLAKSYTAIFRATGDTSKALQDEAIAADVARGRHMDLQASALLVAKVVNGNVGILKRYGIETYKGETATEALAAVQQKYAGQAAAGATAQQKFTAELHNSEVIVGAALLPTVTHLLAEGARWLDQMNQSGRLQRDVNLALRDGAGVVHALEGGVHLLVGVIETADHVTGSFKNTLELLVGLKLVSTFSGWASGIGGVGSEAEIANGKVAALKGTLADLAAIGVVTLTINVLENLIPKKATAGGQKILDQEGLGVLGKIPLLGPVLQTGTFLGRKTGEAAGINYGGSKGGLKIPSRFKTGAEINAYLAGLHGDAPPPVPTITNPGDPLALTAYLAGRDARPKTAAGSTGIPRNGPAKPPPIHQFSLTRYLQNQLAAATTPGADKKAAEEALAYTQKLLNSGRLVGQAYTDALVKRKELYAEIAADAKKATPSGSRNPLPLGEQSALSNAEAAAATKKIPALRALEAEQKHALDILNSQHATGKKLVELDKERATLSKDLAATQAKIASIQDAASKKQADAAKKLADAFKANLQTAFGVLGELGQGPVATGPAAQFVQQYGGTLSAKAYLADITQQNKAGRAELTNLNTLRRRGAPQDLINNLLGQGTAGQGIAQALAHATPAILKAFLGQYREREKVATQIAKMQVAVMHVDKIVDASPTRTDAHDRPTGNKFGRVPNAGRRR